jgi:hypothetical protein
VAPAPAAAWADIDIDRELVSTSAAAMVVMMMALVFVMMMVVMRRFASPFAALNISLYVALNASLDIMHNNLAANGSSSATKRSHEIFAHIVLLLWYWLIGIRGLWCKGILCSLNTILWRLQLGSTIGAESHVRGRCAIAARTMKHTIRNGRCATIGAKVAGEVAAAGSTYDHSSWAS